ncbi:kinase-like domain-containing protein [Hypoxylon argillaceum]|nr:kinase-like domain-containing protein [Hypoxylon argillaceum]KAI1156422.1 kinase-like domain-containing protein [Nemania diffusa]
MDSYTPITLPYFAPADELPASLPTLEEVLSSTNFLVEPFNLTTRHMRVVRVGEHFVAKYGKSVKSLEGENMLFVKQHTTIPVPQVYAIYTFGEGETMLIMEYIVGIPLERCLASWELRRLEPIREQLRAQVNELRQIPAPSYYGSLGRRPLTDFYRDCEYGPFDNFTNLVDKTFELMFSPRNAQRFADMRKFFSVSFDCISTALGHAHPVFTHGDLHENNVIIRPDNTPVLIDWEVAGFYPAYHERLTAELLIVQFDFLDEKFPLEQEIIGDAEGAWYKAIREESHSDNESETISNFPDEAS